MLVRLMYASRAAKPLDGEELGQILKQSRANNARSGVTGLLCTSGELFIQVLEGGRGAVNALYNRLMTDPRHTEVTLLAYDEISERRFAGWAMGQVNLTRLNPAVLLKYAESATLDPHALSGAAAAALFDDLVATASVSCTG